MIVRFTNDSLPQYDHLAFFCYETIPSIIFPGEVQDTAEMMIKNQGIFSKQNFSSILSMIS